MRVNTVKNQSFGANPSRLVREGLAQALVDGKGEKNVRNLMSLIREVYPNKYMTMLGSSEKVYSAGLTDVFDLTAKREFTYEPNPIFVTKYNKLRAKYFPNGILHTSTPREKLGAAVFIRRPDGTSEVYASDAWKKEMADFNRRLDKLSKEEAKLKAKYPPNKIFVINEPEGYISLFKDAEGKPFGGILGILTSALEKIKGQRTLKERALDIVDSMFPAYKDYATRAQVADAANRASFWHQRIG